VPSISEHHVRITEPDYTRYSRKEITPGVSQVYGWNGKKSEVQAYRFDAEKFTPDQAKKWLEDHSVTFKRFDEAQPINKAQVNPEELKAGIKVEAEHRKTIDAIIADAQANAVRPIQDYQEMIAMDHLEEAGNDFYYSKLAKYVEPQQNVDKIDVIKSERSFFEMLKIVKGCEIETDEEEEDEEPAPEFKEEEGYALITKSEPEKQIVYGVVIEPWTDATPGGDAHGDRMTAEEIQKTAHNYLENYRNVDEKHSFKKINAQPVESYLAPVDFDAEDGQKIKAGSWVLAIKVKEQGVWDKIKKGEYNAFSPGGFGYKKEIS